MKPRAGQFLSVNGRDFTYGGEKVSSLFHELGNYFLVFATKSLPCLRTLMEKLDIFFAMKKVYLSGTNTAWISYGYDFGNNAWADHGDQWKAELDRVSLLELAS